MEFPVPGSHGLAGPIDGDGRVSGAKNDANAGKIRRGHVVGRLDRGIAGQSGLGKRWSIIGGMEFVPKQHDFAREVVVAQLLGAPETRLAGANDDDFWKEPS